MAKSFETGGIHHTTHENNPLPVRMNGNTTMHGAVLQEQAIPTIAGSGVYGFIPTNFREFTSGTGTTGIENRMFKVSSGTGFTDYGTLQSFRSINYRTGGSAIIRCSGYFPDPQAATWTGIGGIALGDEISFGYSGTDFGVWHRYGGKAETRTLQITVAASGSETVTLTINGTGHSIPVTSGTVQHNANEIASYVEASVSGYFADQLDDSVQIIAASDGAKAGVWSISSTGSLDGTITQVEAGVTKTSNHIAKEDWNGPNIDRFLVDFNPAMGNNYEIHYSNGFGNINYMIEDSESGRYILAHTIKHTGTTTAQNLGNPSLRCGAYSTCINPSGLSTAVDVYCAYLSGYASASTQRVRNPRGVSNTKNVGTTETSILQLRNRRTYNGFANQAEIEPVVLTLANDGNKQAVYRLLGNPTLNGTPNFQTVGTNLIGDVDTAATTYASGGRVLAQFTVGRLSSETFDLSDLMIRVPPTLRLVITGEMDSGSGDLTAALSYYEDVY